MKSILGNAVRATVLVHGRSELHLRFNNYDELDQAYRELDALEGKPAPINQPQRHAVLEEAIQACVKLSEHYASLGATPQLVAARNAALTAADRIRFLKD